MYTIGQVSEMFSLPVSTLRYYDKEGLFPEIERQSGIRRFSDRELEALRVELIGESVKHNKAVNAYNSRIATFPYSFVAKRKRKEPKGIFVYTMKNTYGI